MKCVKTIKTIAHRLSRASPRTAFGQRCRSKNAVLRELYGPVVKKREVFNAAKLSVCEYIFVPILTFGHGSWVMIERMLSQVQAAEKGSMQRVNCVALHDKVRSCEIRGALKVEPLLRIAATLARPGV